MKTYAEKKTELLDRATALKTEGKLSSSDHAHITNTLIPRYDAWLFADPSEPLNGRLNYLRGQVKKFANKSTPKGTVNIKQRYEQMITELENNPNPEVEAAKIGLYIDRVLDVAEGN